MNVPISKQKEFFQTLIVILERIRLGNGCITCELLKDVSFDNRYRVIGKWEKEYDLQNHISSEDFSVLRGAMSLLHSPPEINLYVVSAIKELDVLHKRNDRHKTTTLRT